MTNSNSGDRNRWTDDRLDQLAATAAANTEAIAGLREQQEATNAALETLIGIATGHQERVTTAEEHIATLLEEIRDIKVEIRGIQTENRRILDHLFGQQQEGEP